MFSNFNTLVDTTKIINWNTRSETEEDPVIIFVSSWISLNYIYSSFARCVKDEYEQWRKSEKLRNGDKSELIFFSRTKQVEELISSLKYDSKNYEVKLPIKSGLDRRKPVPNDIEQTVNILDLNAVDLFLVVYQARNNLFHGSKDPLECERDDQLCQVLSFFLRDFNRYFCKQYL
ncbi:MAG: hypothetical protein ACPGTP_09300 [Bacteroidia bacterium]